MRLSSDQQALATSHYYLAQITARKQGNRRDPDEALSACHLGMVNAAYYWRPDGGRSFKDFAIRCCCHAIIQDYKHRRFAIGRRSRDPRAIETNYTALERLCNSLSPLYELILAEEVERIH